jgi:lysozyme
VVTRTSKRGRAIIQALEGLRLKAYEDSGGEQTIGYGHLVTAEERESGLLWLGAASSVAWRRGILVEQAEALFDVDLRRVEDSLNEEPSITRLRQNEYDALASFVFNIGRSRFFDVEPRNPGPQPSHVLQAIRAGRLELVPVELRRWVHAGGKIVPGLVNRREVEVSLWLEGSAC